MSWLKVLFGVKGRVNRLQYLGGLLGVSLICTAAMFPMMALFADKAPGGGYSDSPRTDAVMWLCATPAAVVETTLMIRRIHDLGRSALLLLWGAIYWAVLLCATNVVWPGLRQTIFEFIAASPLFIALVILQFAPGQKQSNRFGPPNAVFVP